MWPSVMWPSVSTDVISLECKVIQIKWENSIQILQKLLKMGYTLRQVAMVTYTTTGYHGYRHYYRLPWLHTHTRKQYNVYESDVGRLYYRDCHYLETSKTTPWVYKGPSEMLIKWFPAYECYVSHWLQVQQRSYVNNRWVDHIKGSVLLLEQVTVF